MKLIPYRPPGVKLSIVTITARKDPRFQDMADAIARSLRKHPCELEWVVVDYWAWFDKRRNETIRRAVGERFEHQHLPPKPNPWQGPNRITRQDYPAPNNARNTAYIVATGTHIVGLDDCTIPVEDWLYYHQRFATYNKGLCGSYASVKDVKVEKGQLLFADEPIDYTDMRNQLHKEGPQVCEGRWMYGYNFSVPLNNLVKINGFDELFDGELGCEDIDVGIRLERAGLTFHYIPECLVYQVMTTHAPCFAEVTTKKKTLWQDRKEHHANEWLMEALYFDAERVWTCGNYWSLSKARHSYRAGLEFPQIVHPGFDWRNGASLEGM